MFFVLQRAKTWEILDREAPFTADGPEWADSTYGSMTATVPAFYAERRAEDGRRILEEWGTFVHVETGSQRLWTGIVSEIAFDGGQVTVTIVEWLGYLDGLKIRTNIFAVETDPVQIIRNIISDAQSANNLGISVTGSTKLRLGTRSEEGLRNALDAEGREKVALNNGEEQQKRREQDLKHAENELERERGYWGTLIKNAETLERSTKKTYDQKVKADTDKGVELANANRGGATEATIENLTDARKSALTARNTAETAYNTAVDAENAALKDLNTAIKSGNSSNIMAARAFFALKQGDREAKQDAYKDAKTDYTTANNALIAARKDKDKTLISSLKSQKKATEIAKNNAKVTFEGAKNAVVILRNNQKSELVPFQNSVDHHKNLVEAGKAQVAQLKENVKHVQEAVKARREEVARDGGTYKILAADNAECWSEIKDILSATGIRLKTATKRVYGQPELTLEAHYPSMGGDRSDLVFEQGVNIISGFEADQLKYASEVTVTGAGDIRQTASKATERLRRTLMVSEPRLTTKSKASDRAREVLTASKNDIEIQEITVLDHTNCRIGAWQVGDLITLRGSLPGIGDVALKHRVMSWRRLNDAQAILYLTRG